MKKTILLASFINPDKTDYFLNYLENDFNIKKNKVYIFKNIDDESKLIFTFRVNVLKDEPINIKQMFPNSIIIHKRLNVLYTINGLNLLIKEKYPDTYDFIENKTVKLNWGEYNNKIILISNKELKILTISRVFN
jgi:hypothetical protein